MADISQRIEILKQKLVKYSEELANITQKVKSLSSDHLQEIRIKDQELKDFERKLLEFQQNKDSIQKELDEKIAELENSQLTNLEKQTKITKLLVDNKDNLGAICKEILTIWGNYENSRDRIIEMLKKLDEQKQKEIQKLRAKTKATVITALALLLFFVLLFMILIFRQKNKKIINYVKRKRN